MLCYNMHMKTLSEIKRDEWRDPETRGNRLSGSRLRAGGLSRTPEYRAWIAMNQRCYNRNNRYYYRYGGRGINVCDEWRGSGGFLAFFDHIGPKPTQNHSLGRMNNDGNYEPGNVRWETPQQQSDNTCRNRRITIAGATKTFTEWATIAGVSVRAFKGRIESGWPEDRLLEPPEYHKSGHLVNGQHLVTIGGKTQSVSDWARETGIKPETIRGRLRRGCVGYAIIAPTQPRKRFVTIDGVTKTLSEWSEESGVKLTTLSYRLSRGCPPDKLLAPVTTKGSSDNG